MRICVASCTACLLAVSALAGPRSYLGGSAHIGQIAETLSPPAPWQDMMRNGLHFTTYGAQIEGGWMGSFWDVHAGMHFSYARDHEKREHNLAYATTGWQTFHGWYNYRLSAGTRLRVPDRAPNPVKPTLGTGITYGWLTRTYRYEHWDIWPEAGTDRYSESQRRDYSPCFGWLLEMGFLVAPRGSWRYSLLFRFENYHFDVPRGPCHYQEFDGAIQLTAELGVLYTFPKSSASR